MASYIELMKKPKIVAMIHNTKNPLLSVCFPSAKSISDIQTIMSTPPISPRGRIGVKLTLNHKKESKKAIVKNPVE
jgi:hypothetical protein